MSKKFIKLKLGSHQIVHGFNEEHKEIVEEVKAEGFKEKLVNVDRIKSISEQFTLTDYAYGRWIYWGYEGDLTTIQK